jgi:N-acetylglucosamine kinase-like BadF-type ATPase
VADETLKLLGRASGDAGALRSGAVQQAAEAILDTVRRTLHQAGAKRARGLVVGAAGAGREPERGELERALAAAGIADAVRVTTDMEIALVAGLGREPGILVLSGTGSGACARLPSGELRRTGGHGWQFGDEGSGYWLARAAVSAVAQAADGRAPPTALAAALARAADVEGEEALLQWARNASRWVIADLARVVQDVAARGDDVARLLVDQAAQALAAHVRALRPHFRDDAPVAVAFAGGLLRPGSPLRTAVTTLLETDQPPLKMLAALVEPPRGALQLAAQLAP